jgi:hypothetical protein
VHGDRSVQRSAGPSVRSQASPLQDQPGLSLKDGLSRFSPAGGSTQFAAQKKQSDTSVQLKTGTGGGGELPAAAVQSKAAEGVAGATGSLPHADAIQKSFGSHDVSGIKARTGGAAKDAAQEIGAKAYAQGSSTAFADSPDLHTAAHEAAHVMQQKAGKTPAGGVGKAGDALEQEADAVADKVVQGKSAQSLLDGMGGGGAPGGKAVGKLAEGPEVQSESVQLSDSGGGMASADPPPDAAVQRKAAVQMAEAEGPAAPESVTLNVGGIRIKISLPPEVKNKAFTKSISKELAPGVQLTQVKIEFDDHWKVKSGNVSGSLGATLGDKKLKASFSLGVGKGGSVVGHVKDAPIEDGPLSGKLSASWGGKKLKANVKASLTDDVKLPTVKGFSARFLKGTTAQVVFTHDKLLEVTSTSAKVMLVQKGEDRVRLTGEGSYKAPNKFTGDGDVEVIKPFEKEANKAKVKSGKKARGKFKFGSWSFKDLPLHIEFGGGKLSSLLNKFEFDGVGLGGFGSFDVGMPFSLPSIKGWTPKIGTGSKFDINLGKGLLEKLKGQADWELEFGGKSLFAGLWKGISFDPKSWKFTGRGAADLIGDFDMGTFGGFQFRGLGGSKRSKLKSLSLKDNALMKFLGRIDLGVFKGAEFAVGNIDLSWLKGKGLKQAKGKFTFPTMPKWTVAPYTVRLDKNTTAQADFSNNKLNSVSGQVGATVLKSDKELVHGSFEQIKIEPSKKKWSGAGSLTLLSDIPLPKKGPWQATIEAAKGKTVSFRFVASKLKQAKGLLSVRVDHGGKKLLQLGASGAYDGKSFTGTGAAKLLAPLSFKKGGTQGSVLPQGTNLDTVRMVKNALKTASGKVVADIKTPTKYGDLLFRASLAKAKLDLSKEPVLSGEAKAALKTDLTLGEGAWRVTIQKKSAATVKLVRNRPVAIAGSPLSLLLVKDGKKAASVDAKAKLDLKKLTLDVNAKGKLFKGVQLSQSPMVTVHKDSTVDQLVIRKNKLKKVKGSIDVAIDDKTGKRLGEGGLKGAWVDKQGFTGKGQFDLKQETKLKKKGKYEVSLEPTAGSSLEASFTKSKLTRLRGELSVRVDKDGKGLLRAKADGTYNGRDFTGKGSAKLLQDVTWTKGKTKVTLEKKGTELEVATISKSRFVGAKGKASVRFLTQTDSGVLDLRGKLEKAHIDTRKEPSISGDVSAELLKNYTIGKGTWQTQIPQRSKAMLKVRDSKLQTFATNKIALLLLKDKKKAAQIDVQVKFNLRTLVLDAKGSGKLFKDLSFGTKPRVDLEKESAVKEIVIAGNKLTRVEGQVSLAVYDKTDEKLLENASLKGIWTAKAGFSGEGGAKTAKDITAGKTGGSHVVIKKGAGVQKIKITKNAFASAEGGELELEAHDKAGKLLSGGGTLKTLVQGKDGLVFTGSGKLKFFRTLKLGNKTGKGVRVVTGTEVSADVVKNQFARIGGTLKLGVDDSKNEEIATGSLENVDIDMRSEDPIVSGKGTFKTKKEFKIGKLLTVYKDLSANATIVRNELTEASLENASFKIHKLNDGKGADGKVTKADLVFPKVGMPDFSFLGGAVDEFKMLAGKMVGKLQKLSFDKGRFGGLGTARYKPNKVLDVLASLRFDPGDGLMIPWIKLTGDIKIPLLKKYKFLDKGMPGKKKWTLAKFGVTIKGVRAAMHLSAGYEVGTEPMFLKSRLDTGEFNPEKLELPDFTATAEVTGEAYAKGHLTLDGYLGAGKPGTAFAGLNARGTGKPKLTAKLTPKGSIYARGGKLGGKVAADFEVDARASLEASMALVVQLVGQEEKLPDFWKDTLDFGKLFGWKYSTELAFGEPEGKGELTGDVAVSADKTLSDAAEKDYKAAAGVTDQPVTDARKVPGAGGGMKAMEEKIATMEILAGLVKAGIALADLGISSLPPGIKMVIAIVIEGKFMKASNACLELSQALDKAEDSGLLDKLIKEKGPLGKTMELLKEYNAIINDLAGPSVKEMFESSEGVYNFKGNAWIALQAVKRVSKKVNGTEDGLAVLRAWMWRNRPACTWDDVTSRGGMSYAAGALEWLGAIDKGTDPMQEMSDADWARKLRSFKKEWSSLDQSIVDEYLPGMKKYQLAD